MFGSLFIGVVLIVFVNKRPTDHPYIMIISCNGEAEKAVLDHLKTNVKKQVLKSKTVSKEGIEMTLEVRLKGDDSGFVNEIADLQGVGNAVLVSYNGDYMS